MAWFSKSKHAEPTAPGLCGRCGQQPGTALVHFVTTPAPEAPSDGGAALWLCEGCVEIVRREAEGN